MYALLHFAQHFGLDTIAFLAIADFLLGVAVAIRDGVFDVSKMPKILEKAVPYGLGYMGVIAVGNSTLTAAVFAGIVAGMSADILKNVGKLYPGVAIALPNGIVRTPSLPAKDDAPVLTAPQAVAAPAAEQVGEADKAVV